LLCGFSASYSEFDVWSDFFLFLYLRGGLSWYAISSFSAPFLTHSGKAHSAGSSIVPL